jgi:branched-chain amino acid transport system permease protein
MSTQQAPAPSPSAAPFVAAVPSSSFLRRNWVWFAVLALMLVLPHLFYDFGRGRHSGFAITLLSEMALMSIFALSYNMLMGQSGLLSFGHAILFGIGAYSVAHTLNWAMASGAPIPVEIMPLVGGLGGMVCGILAGYVATKQRATAFAMITMGLGELFTASALMFMTFFGGEGGITTNRMLETSIFGVTYSQPIQVYYLLVGWAMIAAFLMYLQTQTPLGRMANATRDNYERTQFVGYDPRVVRYWQFILAGFFAGIAGGMYCLVYEIVTFDTLAAVKSANALLATYIGGAGGFFGPVLGATLVVSMQSGISLYTSAWLLYLGVVFIAMVMFAPGGLLGLIAMHGPIARMGRMRELLVPYLRLLGPGVVMTAGFVLFVELVTHHTIGAAQGKKFSIAGFAPDAYNPVVWAAAVAAMVAGALWLRAEGRGFIVRWNALIEDAKARGIVS